MYQKKTGDKSSIPKSLLNAGAASKIKTNNFNYAI
jgi:hypothetical protein